MSDDDANPSEQLKDGFNRFCNFLNALNERWIFVSLIVSFLWQEHQALNEKSEYPTIYAAPRI
jgi:hypothetical protein